MSLSRGTHVAVAWFVNKPIELDEGGCDGYIAKSEWKSPTPAAHAALLVRMNVGDPIACKSVARLRRANRLVATAGTVSRDDLMTLTEDDVRGSSVFTRADPDDQQPA